MQRCCCQKCSQIALLLSYSFISTTIARKKNSARSRKLFSLINPLLGRGANGEYEQKTNSQRTEQHHTYAGSRTKYDYLKKNSLLKLLVFGIWVAQHLKFNASSFSMICVSKDPPQFFPPFYFWIGSRYDAVGFWRKLGKRNWGRGC